jgi:Tol biopolymer transport system component
MRDDSGRFDASRDAPAAPACDVTKPFDTPAPVGELNTSDNDRWGWLTADQLTVYFARALVPYNDYQIYTANRADREAPFTGLTALDMVNTIYGEARPVVSPDGLSLYFEFVDSAGADIRISTRGTTSEPFAGQSSVPELETAKNEFNPWLADDGRVIYFTSDRDGFNDIFIATRAGIAGPFGTPVAVAELNSGYGDYMGALRGDGLEIFMGTSRDTNFANDDIFNATRASTSDPFGAPTKIGELSSASTDEFPTWVSSDGCQLLFSSNRPGSGSYDVWLARRPP